MNIQLMKLRKAAGYSSRDEFAEKLGVNKYTYRSWESGAAMMNIEQVCMCATVLGCTPNDILGWESCDTAKTSPVEQMTNEEREIVDNYRQSSPAWQQNIATTARLAAGESKQD